MNVNNVVHERELLLIIVYKFSFQRVEKIFMVGTKKFSVEGTMSRFDDIS